jgi:hypothetical protein
MRWLGYAWNIAAVWFLLSVISSPFFLTVRKARARGKRLFATEPAARVDALKHDHSHDHIWDA